MTCWPERSTWNRAGSRDDDEPHPAQEGAQRPDQGGDSPAAGGGVVHAGGGRWTATGPAAGPGKCADWTGAGRPAEADARRRRAPVEDGRPLRPSARRHGQGRLVQPAARHEPRGQLHGPPGACFAMGRGGVPIGDVHFHFPNYVGDGPIRNSPVEVGVMHPVEKPLVGVRARVDPYVASAARLVVIPDDNRV
jgi:hypothetical protein